MTIFGLRLDPLSLFAATVFAAYLLLPLVAT